MLITNNIEQFLEQVGNVKKCDLHLELYVYNNYKCACGNTHTFDYNSELLCQGSFKLILGCPDNKKYITCVKLKSKFLGFGFSGFESVLGLKLNEDEDELLLFRSVINTAIMMR